jgi:hypothetical protein
MKAAPLERGWTVLHFDFFILHSPHLTLSAPLG